MLLKTRFKIVIFFLFLIFVIAEMAILRFVVFDSFVSLEKEEAFNDIDRIDHAINREIHHLGLLCHDWASWDDMYEFVQDANQEFVKTNLTYVSFKTNNCNLIAVFDVSLNIVLNRAFDLENGALLKFKNFSDEKQLSEKTLIRAAFLKTGTNENHGVIETEYGPMLVVSRPIKKSEESGQPNGVLIMGRFLGKKTVADLIEQTKVKFSIECPVIKESYQKMEVSYASYQGKKEAYFVEKEEGLIRIKKEFMDLNKKPAFLIEVILPRSITQRGVQVMNFTAAYMMVVGVIILFVSGLILRQRVFSPLEKMARHMETIEDGTDYSLRLRVKRKDEIGVLGTLFDKMMDRIESQNLELLRVNGILQGLSSIDELTQIANRRALNQHLEYEWNRMKREKKPISVILCDVDYFKQYNDHYGHQQGDLCLRKVADLLSKIAQRSCDLVARYGGEEFVIILSGTDSEGATHMAVNLSNLLKEQQIPHEASKAARFVTISLGIATITPTDDYRCEDVLRIADEALYKAKANGRNRFEAISA